MGDHLIDGRFQSDKFPTTPRGLVPLSCEDKTAQDLLWEYAQRRRSKDAEFSEDLETALRLAGYDPRRPCGTCGGLGTVGAGADMRRCVACGPTPGQTCVATRQAPHGPGNGPDRCARALGHAGSHVNVHGAPWAECAVCGDEASRRTAAAVFYCARHAPPDGSDPARWFL